MECTGCGLVQLAGKPVPYYREVIRATAYSAEMGQFRRQQLGDLAQRFNLAGKPLLEVGCGRGEYLSLLHEVGILAEGTEWSPRNIAACRAKGFTAHRAFLSRTSQRLPGGPYPAFACFNFMEHWPSPVDSLSAIRENLTPEGIGIVEVPNFDMIINKALYSEFIRDHLSYFTLDTLRFTLQAAGFDILECRTIWQDYILSAVVRRRPPLDTKHFVLRQDAIQRALVDFVSSFPDGSVAVWGAGHQALATLALTGIAHRIRYVVDSAPFKQGCLTPATHRPIVAPAHLAKEPVDAVIVMAAGFSDEVARQIRATHPASMTVRILREDRLEAA